MLGLPFDNIGVQHPCFTVLAGSYTAMASAGIWDPVFPSDVLHVDIAYISARISRSQNRESSKGKQKTRVYPAGKGISDYETVCGWSICFA